jgi:hypothetical protein
VKACMAFLNWGLFTKLAYLVVENLLYKREVKTFDTRVWQDRQYKEERLLYRSKHLHEQFAGPNVMYRDEFQHELKSLN